MCDVHLSCTATDKGQTRVLPSSAEQRPSSSSGRSRNGSPQEEAPLGVTGPGSPRPTFIVPIRTKSRPDRPEPIGAIDHLSVRVSWARGLPAARASLEPRTECLMRKGVEERILQSEFTFQDGRLPKFERNENWRKERHAGFLYLHSSVIPPPLSPTFSPRQERGAAVSKAGSGALVSTEGSVRRREVFVCAGGSQYQT